MLLGSILRGTGLASTRAGTLAVLIPVVGYVSVAKKNPAGNLKMPQTIIYLDEELSKKLEDFCDKNKLSSKNDGIIRLIKIGLKVKQ